MSVEEKLKRALSDIVRVIESGGEVVIDDPDIRVFMQNVEKGVGVAVYVPIFRRDEVDVKSEYQEVKAQVIVDCVNCDCALISDPYTRTFSWSFTMRAPVKIKSYVSEKFGKKIVHLDLIKL
ncbi:MAG: hypothetical protein QXF74_05660 [Nitrososphaerota archaeon]